ncbi:MAG TPA: ribose-5-phosphate isomerase RpiA [Candidatus Binataceae bacterium]|jgi:ribose 5-phosphate isomerase A|nr:ribose-5-phosphate isomerase RpiA [Candidatus Binataceae bacterium]
MASARRSSRKPGIKAKPPVPAESLEALGRYAIRYVKPGQTIGLGTGHAATAFIRALAEVMLGVRGVPTSNASAELATALGIPLVELSEVDRLDLDFDGADEVDPKLNMIKGWGGAMVREKVVAAASRRRIFLVGEEKLVRRLGKRGRLPIEIVPFALPYATQEIARRGLKPRPRATDSGQLFVTDNGNYIVDCAVKEIANPRRLERDLLAIPGVVGTGLFLGIADLVLVAARDGSVKTLRRRPAKA